MSDGAEAILELRARLFTGSSELVEGVDCGTSAEDVRAATETLEAGLARYTLWRQAAERGVAAPVEVADTVLGAIAELGQGGGWALIVGFPEGAASMYLSSGGGVIGGEAHEAVRGAAAEFCAAAAASLSELPPGDVPDPGPGDGRVRFSVLTPAGLRNATTPALGPDDTAEPLYPLFAAMHGLIGALREADEAREGAGTASDEPAYVNCLLTTLAHNPDARARTASAGPLPDLVPLAASADDADWIRSHDFDLAGLDAGAVVDMLVGLTSFGVLRKSRGKLAVQLATGQGEAVPVSFSVTRSTGRGGGVELEIARA